MFNFVLKLHEGRKSVVSLCPDVLTVIINFSLADLVTIFQRKLSLQSKVIEKGYKKVLFYKKMAKKKLNLGFAVCPLYVQLKKQTGIQVFPQKGRDHLLNPYCSGIYLLDVGQCVCTVCPGCTGGHKVTGNLLRPSSTQTLSHLTHVPEG